jgi:hypothetical protein
MTEEDMKKLPRPTVADAIVSTPHTYGNKTVTTPLRWGAIATSLTDPESSSEEEQVYSGQTLNTYQDTWSIQGNTNTFTCSSCQNGFPFDLSAPGDGGWIQFVYQQKGDNHGNDSVGLSRLCVWIVDTTAACAQVSPQNGCIGDGYKPYCVSPFNTGNLSPIAGSGSSSSLSEVVGYLECGKSTSDPNVGPNGCIIWTLGYLANAQDPGWWAASAPDSMGLHNNWTSVGGSLYGMGNGGKAVFTNATLNTTVVANSCYNSANPPPSLGSTIFVPTACSAGLTQDDLTATLAKSGGNGTAETNNLTSCDATFSTSEYDSRLAWAGTTGQFTTQTKVGSGENPSYYGDSVTFTAAVTSSSGCAPSGGSVQFAVDGNTIGTAPLSGGSASIQASAWLSGGKHTVTAKYSGSTLFASSSGSVKQTINAQETDTRVDSNENPSYYGDVVTFSASVSDRIDSVATGTVQFMSDGKPIGKAVTLSGGNATIQYAWVPAGSHTITAKYNGDSSHSPSTGYLQGVQTVNKQQTDTRVSSNENPSYYGDTVTFTADVNDRDDTVATGSVEFFSDGNTLGTVTMSGGSANLQVTNLVAGNHTITAKYLGDKNHSPGTGYLQGVQTVNQQQTDIRVGSNKDPSSYGDAVTFTADVNDRDDTVATGKVQFFADGNSLGTVTLSGGSATLKTSSLAVGNHTVVAVYNGDANHMAGTGYLQGVQTVNQVSTTTTVGSGENPSNAGDSVTFTAAVTGSGGYPTGTVQFQVDGNNVGDPAPVKILHLFKLTSNFATSPAIPLLPGNHTVTAVYSGDTHYTGSSGALANGQTVKKAVATTAVRSSENPSISGNSVTFTVTVRGLISNGMELGGTFPTGKVQFMVDNEKFGEPVPLSHNEFSRLTGMVTASLATSKLPIGSHKIVADYLGDDNFTAGNGALKGGQIVNPKPKSL